MSAPVFHPDLTSSDRLFSSPPPPPPFFFPISGRGYATRADRLSNPSEKKRRTNKERERERKERAGGKIGIIETGKRKEKRRKRGANELDKMQFLGYASDDDPFRFIEASLFFLPSFYRNRFTTSKRNIIRRGRSNKPVLAKICRGRRRQGGGGALSDDESNRWSR